MRKDPYKILGIHRTANDAEIRAAYRALARKYHPDAGAGSSAEKFREIQEAYEILSNPRQRAAFDAAGSRKSPVAARRGKEWPTSPGIRVARSDPGHIDLRDLSSRPKPEPIGSRRGSELYVQMSPWADLEDLMRLLDLLNDRYW